MALSLQPTTGQRKPYQRGMFQQPAALGQAKPLQAPQPLTQAGGLAQQNNLKSLQTGQFADVQSAQNATNRAGALRQYQAIQSSRANALRGNLSTEQAQRMQDQSLASANSQNLTAQNSVNSMQRQYGQDAMNQANAYEQDAYGKATTERGYQDSRSDLGYNRATDEKRYGDSRGDVAFGQNLQTKQFDAGRSDTAFNQGMAKDQFGANRQDAAFSQGLARDQFGANRDDALYSRGYQASRDAVGDTRYDTQYADSRSDIGYSRGEDKRRYDQQFAAGREDVGYSRTRDEIGDKRYDQSYADQRGDLAYDRTTDQARYGDTRADVADSQQFRNTQYGDQRADVKYGQQYQASRDQVGDTRYDAATAYSQGRDAIGDQRYGQEYADSRGDVQYARGIDQSRYADARGDVAYGQQYQASRDAVGDTRYNQQYQDQRGDVQYQRGYQENRDAVGDTRYNSETAYNQGRDAIGDQRYDASTQYQQSRDALGDQRYDQSYADSRGDTLYNRTESQRLEGKGDVNSLISSVQDPRAQNLLRNVQAQGGDVQAMYNTMLDNGTIKEEYASSSPGTLAAKAKVDELKSYYPMNAGETKEAYDTRIQGMALAEREQERAAIQKPMEDAKNKATGEEVLNILANGGTPTQEQIQVAIKSGAIPTLSQANLPIGPDAMNKFSQEHGGKMINIGGTVYMIKPQAATFGNTNVSEPIFVNNETGERSILQRGGLKAIPKNSLFSKA